MSHHRCKIMLKNSLIMEPSKPLVLDVNRMKTSIIFRDRMPLCCHHFPIPTQSDRVTDTTTEPMLTFEEEVSSWTFTDGDCCGAGHCSLDC